MTAEVSTQQETDREIVVSRIIEGPWKVVFDAFSDVTHLGKWWVPDQTTLTLAERGDTTEATLRLVFGSKEQRDQAALYHAVRGAQQSLDSLAAFVAGGR